MFFLRNAASKVVTVASDNVGGRRGGFGEGGGEGGGGRRGAVLLGRPVDLALIRRVFKTTKNKNRR